MLSKYVISKKRGSRSKDALQIKSGESSEILSLERLRNCQAPLFSVAFSSRANLLEDGSSTHMWHSINETIKSLGILGGPVVRMGELKSSTALTHETSRRTDEKRNEIRKNSKSTLGLWARLLFNPDSLTPGVCLIGRYDRPCCF